MLDDSLQWIMAMVKKKTKEEITNFCHTELDVCWWGGGYKAHIHFRFTFDNSRAHHLLLLQ